MFNAVDFVEKYACNDTVVLPCIVTNLKENNDSSMHVSWKRQGQVIFSFNGPEQRIYRHESVPSANFLSKADLFKGIASLRLKNAEAPDGNYSCEVTELNREGETKMKLRTHMGELSVIFFVACWEPKTRSYGKGKLMNVKVLLLETGNTQSVASGLSSSNTIMCYFVLS